MHGRPVVSLPIPVCHGFVVTLALVVFAAGAGAQRPGPPPPSLDRPPVIRPADLARAALGRRLSDQLLEIRVRRLAVMAAAARQESDWTAAVTHAEQLEQVYPQEKPALAAVTALRVQHAAFRLQAKDYSAARAELVRV